MQSATEEVKIHGCCLVSESRNTTEKLITTVANSMGWGKRYIEDAGDVIYLCTDRSTGMSQNKTQVFN